MIEKYCIDDIHIGICWAPDRDYLYDTRLQKPKDSSTTSGFTPLTGWRNYGGLRVWFLCGLRTTAQEVFESLSEEEKAEIIWELNEWK